MDINKKVEELQRQREAIISQIAPALQQVAFLDGQLALLREMKQEQENSKEGKEG